MRVCIYMCMCVYICFAVNSCVKNGVSKPTNFQNEKTVGEGRDFKTEKVVLEQSREQGTV